MMCAFASPPAEPETAAVNSSCSLSRLRTVELQLIMRLLDERSLLIFARCSRVILAAAMHPFARLSLAPLQRRCGGESRSRDAPEPRIDSLWSAMSSVLSSAAKALGFKPSHDNHGGRLRTPVDLELRIRSPVLRNRRIAVTWTLAEHASRDDLGEQIAAFARMPPLHGLSLLGHAGKLWKPYTHNPHVDFVLSQLREALFAGGHHRTLVKVRIYEIRIGEQGCRSLLDIINQCPLLDDLGVDLSAAMNHVDASHVRQLLTDMVPAARRVSRLSLTRSCMSTVDWSPSDESLLAALIDHADSRLRSLDVDVGAFHASMISAFLRALPRCTQLERLRIDSRDAYQPMLMDDMSFEEIMTRLTEQPLGVCYISDATGEALAQFVRHGSSLTALDLSRSMFTDAAVTSISHAARDSPMLRSLHLGILMSDESVAVLASALRSSTLQEFGLNLDDAARVSALIPALAQSSLSSLSVRGIEYLFPEDESSVEHSPYAVRSLCTAVGAMQSLRSFALHTALDDAVCSALADSMRLSRSLRTLDVSACQLNDERIEMLMAALPASSLTQLNLSRNVAATRRCHSAIVAAVAASPQLRRLDLLPSHDGQGISADALRPQLQRVHPTLVVRDRDDSAE